MININVVCVGNLKEDYWQQAVKEYQKRISAFAKINVVEVKESVYGTSEKDILLAKSLEAKKLEAYKKGYCVALEVNAKNYDSPSFAQHLKDLANKG
ncbi:MAG: 23S rRNA (pseudouridine(1915)-N(3))-methyltransferase RlmH, partial [Christensenellales bacterium]